MTPTQTPDEAKLVIVRKLHAPKEAVFNACSSAEALAQWWGSAGSTITVIRFDFVPGGTFHYKMEVAGQVMWGRFVYGEIISPDSIEFTSSFANESGNISKSPFPMDFPLEVFNRLSLEEADGVTTLKLAGHPVNATDGQEATYRAIMPGIEQGFEGTFAQLEKYLRLANANS